MTEHVTDENQLNTSDNRRYPHTDCGLAVAAGMAIDAGIAPSQVVIAAMERWYTQHGDSPADGTGVAVNVLFLQNLGLDATDWVGDQSVADALLDQGFRVCEAIYSNHAGYPYSGPGCTGHFIELCWRTPSGYHVMQPVGGTEPEYTWQTVADNSQRCGFVVKHDYRGAGVSPVPETSPTVTGSPRDTPMMISEKNAWVRTMFLAALGREPESGAVQQQYAAAIHDDGSNVDEVLTSIADSPEGRAHRGQ